MYHFVGDFNLNLLNLENCKKVQDFDHKQTKKSDKKNSHCNRPHPHKHFCG